MADQRSTKGNVIPLKERPCPQCGRPAVDRFRPFCSSRCANADLGRWLSGQYRIATDEEANVDEDPPEDH
ncbi:MAG: DNA gyrase inhibitor YacG [Rhodospirillales bacterium]|nr:DNA gyrase inhibitor YacG [Rhodospirillales bacterium]